MSSPWTKPAGDAAAPPALTNFVHGAAHKPPHWYQRHDEDGTQLACSLDTGKTDGLRAAPPLTGASAARSSQAPHSEGRGRRGVALGGAGSFAAAGAGCTDFAPPATDPPDVVFSRQPLMPRDRMLAPDAEPEDADGAP